MTKVILIDKEKSRKENLEKKIKDCNVSIKSYLNIWGVQKDKNPEITKSTFDNLETGDIYFIHTSNTGSNDLIQYLQNKEKTVWIIEYSGGGESYMGKRKPASEYHLIFPNAVNITENIPKDRLLNFFEAIKNNHEHPFNKLTNFDPELEAKLILLHKLLDRQKIGTIEDEFEDFEDFIKREDYIHFKTLVEKDPLKDYNNLLSDFRDKLLETHL